MRSLTLILSGSLLVTAGAADAVMIRDYQLNGSYADALGNGAIDPLGDVVLGATGVSFDAGEGLQLNGIALSTYSIESVFRFDELGFYRRIYDFLNRTDDTGLYAYDSEMSFFNVAAGPSGAFAPNVPVRVILTRDGATDNVTGYVNGVQQISFTDSDGLAIIGSTLTFFADNTSGNAPGEESAGFVDSIRIYDNVLSADDVAALGGAVPEPATWAMMILGFGLVGAAVRRRRMLANA